MIRFTLSVVVLALAFTACGGGSGPGSTPEDSFKAIQSAVAAKDWNALVEFVPPSAIAEGEAEFEENMKGPGGAMMAAMLGMDPEEVKNMNFKEFTAAMFKAMFEKDPKQLESVMEAEIVKSEINGDKATLTIKTADGEEPVKMVQENGSWYMADFGN